MKSILFCGNCNSAEIIPEVVNWGYRVYLISNSLLGRGIEAAHDVEQANCADPQSALAAAERLVSRGGHFDGVLSLCYDCPESVSAIAAQYGLLAIDYATAVRASLKSKRSAVFEDCGIPAPRYRIVNSEEELTSVGADLGFPLVLKPVDNASCRGVVRVDLESELLQSYLYALSYSCGNPAVIANQFITGTEHSVEGIMVDGCYHCTAFSDRIFRYKEYGPYFVEEGDVMPSALSEELIAECIHTTERAAHALGIDFGVVKADIICPPQGGPLVLEITPRLGGPRFGTEMVPLSNGTCILRAAIQQAVGEEIDASLLLPKFTRGMVNRSLFPAPGIIKSINGLSEVYTIDGFYDFKWWSVAGLKVGDAVLSPENNSGEVGYFIVHAETRERAIELADEIERMIEIQTVSKGM